MQPRDPWAQDGLLDVGDTLFKLETQSCLILLTKVDDILSSADNADEMTLPDGTSLLTVARESVMVVVSLTSVVVEETRERKRADDDYQAVLRRLTGLEEIRLGALENAHDSERAGGQAWR